MVYSQLPQNATPRSLVRFAPAPLAMTAAPATQVEAGTIEVIVTVTLKGRSGAVENPLIG